MISRRKFLKCAGIFAVAIAAFAGCTGPGLVAGPGSAEEWPLRVAVFVDKGARNIGAFRWLEITARMRGAVATPVDGEAVRGIEPYFNAERGTFRMVGKKGDNEWAPDAENGPHIRITEKMSKFEVARVIDELMTRKPKHGSK